MKFLCKKWLVVTGLCFLFMALLVGCAQPAEEAVEPPPSEAPASDPAPADDVAELVAEYVGSESCASCHSELHKGWQQTMHPYMIQEGSKILPEAKAALEAELAKGNSDFLHISPDGPVLESLNQIDYVVGGFFKQRFAVHTDEGVRFLTAQYNVPSEDLTIYSSGRNYEDRCVACHVTGFDLEKSNTLDRSADDYSLLSISAELGIGCEACHGPGSLHLTEFTNPDYIVNPADFTIEEQVNFCGTCHARNAGHVELAGRQDPVGYQFRDSVYDIVRVLSIANNLNVWSKTENGEIVGYFDAEEGGSQRWYDDAGARAHRMQFNEMEMGPHWDVLSCTDCHNMHGVNDEGRALYWNFAESCFDCHGDKYDPAEYMPMRVRSSNQPDARNHTFLPGGAGVHNPDIPTTADSN